jgi:oligopeptide/dipeptide ABC transporter ATP-binding protein
LVSNPDFIVCDEPVSALDVSIQAQIIALLLELKRDLGLTYLFISHDISVIGYLSDRVAVMYLGDIVPEIGAKRARGRVRLQGDLPSPLNPPPGCKFHTRCPLAVPACRTLVPETRGVGPGHSAACHRLEEGLSLLEGAR